MSKKKNASSASTKVVETGVAIDYRVNLKCKNAKQKELVKSIYENDIIFVEGVFGVGKTFVINSVALEMLKEPNNGIDKIILIVPTCSCSATMELGHLPGSLDEKLYNFLIILENAIFLATWKKFLSCFFVFKNISIFV